jgi:hypothetical protein
MSEANPRTVGTSRNQVNLPCSVKLATTMIPASHAMNASGVSEAIRPTIQNFVGPRRSNISRSSDSNGGDRGRRIEAIT